MSKLADKLVKEIKSNINDALEGAESQNTDYNRDEELENAIRRSIEPLVDQAIIPLATEVGELKDAVSQMNEILPKAFTSIGAGTAAAGAAGASTYTPIQGKVKAELKSIEIDIKEITSE